MSIIQVKRYQNLAVAKADKLAEINAACDVALSDIRSQYPQSEIDSWPQQEQEALAYQADSGADTPLLDLIASGRGIPKEQVVTKVLANAQAFKAQAGAAFGRRQAKRDAIDAATTVRDVVAVQW